MIYDQTKHGKKIYMDVCIEKQATYNCLPQVYFTESVKVYCMLSVATKNRKKF